MTGSYRVTRLAVGTALPLGLMALAVLPPLLLASRLPDPLATHWAGPSGRPDGTLSPTLYALVNLFSGIPAAIAVRLARRRAAAPGEIAPAYGIAIFTVAVTAFLSCAVVAANLDAPTWQDASLGPLRVLAALAGSFAVALAGANAARRLERAAPAAPEIAPSAGLRAGERAVWISRARGPWALPVAAVLISGGVALGLWTQIWIGGLAALLAAAALPFTSLRVRADRHGVELRYGAFGWPRSRIALAQIRRASALELAPMQWGGWGYRGSRRLFRKAAVVLRAGPALRLDLADGTLLVVTVDDAASGAGLLNDLLARRPPAAGGA